MDLSFIVPSRNIPVGGVLSMYRFAEALLDFDHQVRIVHVDFAGIAPTPPEELEHLVTFDPRVSHEVIDRFDGRLDGGDAVFCFDSRVPEGAGLPLMWIQAVLVLHWPVEAAIFRATCPKLCTSSWLQHVARSLGNADHQTVVAPYGVDSERFRPMRPMEDRSRGVLMLYSPHPAKGATLGIEALVAAKRELPDLQATLFGTSPRPPSLPAWIDFRLDPPQAQLASIYNDHRAYVMTSFVEGFGITGIEAQACGTPLIVTANGGSVDYATHERSAMVVPPRDAAALTRNIVRVMSDDQLARRISVAGRTVAKSFTWQRGAGVIDDLLRSYAADPAYYQAPMSTVPDLEEFWTTVAELLEEFDGRPR